MRRYLTTLVFAFAACLSWDVPGHAQAAQPRSAAGARVPALLVLVDTLSQEAPGYRILRFPVDGDVPSDVILLPRSADPELITDAIQALQMIRSHVQNRVDAPAMLRVRVDGRRVGRGRVLPWAGRVLGDLRSAAPRDLAGLGNVRAIRIWLPAP